MKKKLLSLFLAGTIATSILTGCTEADNFNLFRRVVVVNVMSDKILFELDGYFSINVDEDENQLEITCEVGNGVYKKLLD